MEAHFLAQEAGLIQNWIGMRGAVLPNLPLTSIITMLRKAAGGWNAR
jgi:hypothetical protein